MKYLQATRSLKDHTRRKVVGIAAVNYTGIASSTNSTFTVVSMESTNVFHDVSYCRVCLAEFPKSVKMSIDYTATAH